MHEAITIAMFICVMTGLVIALLEDTKEIRGEYDV